MDDVESENTIDSDAEKQEDEYANEPIEPQEPKTCCHCGQIFPFNHLMFDCDGCSHFTCVSCRFDETHCILCEPASKEVSSMVQVDTSVGSLNELKSKHFQRRRFNKDHIVDVELSTEEGKVQKQMCTVCKRVFKKSNARYHYMCATGEKPLVCKECGLKFVKKSHFEAHMNSHYGVRPYKCTHSECKASFTQKDKLVRHTKSHNKETRLMCSLCDKLYTSQDILNRHMVKVHSSTKPFRCEQCPRTFKYTGSLRIHRLKHQAKRDYMCEICGKKYTLSAQLKIHKQSHVTYHSRPFKCRLQSNHCGKRFISQRDRARHELTHNSCHDFECSLCNTTFKRKDNLERHMKNFHQDDPPVLTKKVATVAPFNINPVLLKKKDCDNVKKTTNKLKKSKGNNQDVTERAKLKLKQKIEKHDITKESLAKNNIVKSGKISLIASKQINVGHRSDFLKSPISNTNSHQKNSVIVSPHQNVPQNRPSVIKSLPQLLPYRVLPPDKRFLKLNEEHNKIISHSETQTSNVGMNHLQSQINSLTTHINPESPTDLKLRAGENLTILKSVRQRTSKDNALNQCFRIIQHTDAIRTEIKCAQSVSTTHVKSLKNNLGAVMRSEDKNPFRPRQQQRFPSIIVSTLPVHANSQEIRTHMSVSNSVKHVEYGNNSINTNIGGPSLSANLTDNVLEINHEDNFTCSYMSTGETTSSSSCYTPYFESDYFRDSINSYDSTVENLLPNDLDIGFQYINEQLSCSEMTLSGESRIIRYVSQEAKSVRES